MALLVLAAMAVGGVLAARAVSESPSRSSTTAAVTRPATTAQARVTAVQTGQAPWKLAAPLSRMVVLPGAGSGLVVGGGLTTGQKSAVGLFNLDTTNGTLTHFANLTAPGIHDAAAANVGGTDYVFGGGSSTTVGKVQAVAAPAAPAVPVGPGGSASVPTATLVGSLPNPRSDAVAVTAGSTTYLVGGYDGSNPDPQVLATTDGHTFTVVASLPVPVRYPAAASVDGRVFVFGGQAVGTLAPGAPVDTIQVVDPVRHRASIIGHLPQPLEGASAVTIGNQVYVIGGDGASAAPAPNTEARSSSTVGTIWALNPSKGTVAAVGQLQVPVSHAGVAVIGKTAWIVGGESNGQIASVVQQLTRA